MRAKSWLSISELPPGFIASMATPPSPEARSSRLRRGAPAASPVALPAWQYGRRAAVRPPIRAAGYNRLRPIRRFAQATCHKPALARTGRAQLCRFLACRLARKLQAGAELLQQRFGIPRPALRRRTRPAGVDQRSLLGEMN